MLGSPRNLTIQHIKILFFQKIWPHNLQKLVVNLFLDLNDLLIFLIRVKMKFSHVNKYCFLKIVFTQESYSSNFGNNKIFKTMKAREM